jgi:prepilin-type processing-associated H-X9-DG protein
VNAALTLAKIQRPAESVMILESTWDCPDLGDWVARKKDPPACDWGQGFNTHRGKGGLMNWAFFDGHAKAMKMMAVMKRNGQRGQGYNLMGREDGTTAQTNELDLDQENNICDFYK